MTKPRKAHGRVRLFDVSVRWSSGRTIVSTVSARSASAARMEVWRGDVYGSTPFREFLRFSTVRSRGAAPIEDGYAYVRRYYGVEVRTGDRVTVRDCGGCLDGKLGTVAYPGLSASRVHIIFDHLGHALQVHPSDVLPPPLDLPASAGAA